VDRGRRFCPALSAVVTDSEALRSVGWLLRRYHKAVRSFAPPHDLACRASWQTRMEGRSSVTTMSALRTSSSATAKRPRYSTSTWPPPAGRFGISPTLHRAVVRRHRLLLVLNWFPRDATRKVLRTSASGERATHPRACSPRGSQDTEASRAGTVPPEEQRHRQDRRVVPSRASRSPYRPHSPKPQALPSQIDEPHSENARVWANLC
jgi:hypothetical protein